MTDVNPYATPGAAVSDVDDPNARQPTPIMTAKGRIGRLRYLAWSVLSSMLFLLALVAISIPLGLMSGGGEPPAAGAMIVGLVAIVGVIVLLVVNIFWTIRRFHDFNASGWWALLLLILGGLLQLVLYIIPGTDGGNRFGPRPVPNSTGVKVGAALGIILMVLGIVGYGFFFAQMASGGFDLEALEQYEQQYDVE